MLARNIPSVHRSRPTDSVGSQASTTESVLISIKDGVALGTLLSKEDMLITYTTHMWVVRHNTDGTRTLTLTLIFLPSVGFLDEVCVLFGFDESRLNTIPDVAGSAVIL